MIALSAFIVAIVIIDLYGDWVTPYLEAVRRDRGDLASIREALEIMTL